MATTKKLSFGLDKAGGVALILARIGAALLWIIAALAAVVWVVFLISPRSFAANFGSVDLNVGGAFTLSIKGDLLDYSYNLQNFHDGPRQHGSYHLHRSGENGGLRSTGLGVLRNGRTVQGFDGVACRRQGCHAFPRHGVRPVEQGWLVSDCRADCGSGELHRMFPGWHGRQLGLMDERHDGDDWHYPVADCAHLRLWHGSATGSRRSAVRGKSAVGPRGAGPNRAGPNTEGPNEDSLNIVDSSETGLNTADSNSTGPAGIGHIVLRLDRIMVERGRSLNWLADQVGITNVNLSKIKNNRVSAIRFSALAAICAALDCQPGDILEYVDGISGDADDANSK